MTKPAYAHWSDYWTLGTVTSLPEDFKGNYDGEIAEFWRRQFQGVPEQGQILDVCTGNGAIALLAAEFARASGRAISITAVDAAAIRPDVLASRHPRLADLVESVTFIENAPLESLEFAAESCDLITSQYGVEYCDLKPAAKKISALLKPAGVFASVCHAAGSAMLAYMEREQAEYEELERVGLFKALREFQEGELSISHFRKSLSGIRARLLEAYLDSNSALFQGIIQSLDRLLIMNRDKLRASKDKVGRYRSQLRHARARLADMLRVNRALQADPEWYRVFVEQGLEPLDSGEILYRGRHHSGTFYRFRKPA